MTTSHSQQRFGVVIPIGPSALELARGLALIRSLSLWEASMGWCVLVENPTYPTGLAEVAQVRPTCQMVSMQIGGGLTGKILGALSWLQSHTDAAFALKVDTDALAIGPFCNYIVELLAQTPDAGMLGAIGLSANPTVRYTQDLKHREPELLTLRRLLPVSAVDSQLGGEEPIPVAGLRSGSITSRRLNSFNTLRPHIDAAANNGYASDEYCQGGAFAVSRVMLDRMATASYYDFIDVWSNLNRCEDRVLAMYTYAVGLRLIDCSHPTQPFGVQWQGLPYSLDELVRGGYSLIHSVKNDRRYSENEIRDFFRQREPTVA